MSRAKCRKCNTKGCRNRARKGAADCSKCHQRKFRERNPLSAAYAKLKWSAKRRGIEFTITRVQFECFCKLSGYLEKTGNEGHSLTVDRKDNLKGYVPGNIQPLTRARNAEKRMKFDAVRYRAGYRWAEAPDAYIPDDEDAA
jgi:hypothetical protein